MRKNSSQTIALICVFTIMQIVIQGCSSNTQNREVIYQNLSPIDSLHNIWEISQPGEITWNIKENNHVDHIEMSGLQVSGIIRYGIDENGSLVLSKKVVWPMLRTIPNDTHASLIHDFSKEEWPEIVINGEIVKEEKPKIISFNGILSILSSTLSGSEIQRDIFPSTTKPVIVELITIRNRSDNKMIVDINPLAYKTHTPDEKSVYGSYLIEAKCKGTGRLTLQPTEEVQTMVTYSAQKNSEEIEVDGNIEKINRGKFVASLFHSLELETPDTVINEMFRFAKIRAAESIYATKGGLMHSPGGGRYYAAIWANDQAEYVNPFFPFLGNNNGNESAINSFRHFARFMNPDFNPIPSSIIAEGMDIWDGAGDRGDAAMIAYGASRFALAYGRPDTAKVLLPLIQWCLEYCEKQMLPEGVIASDSDELEGRFPSGKANLSTNMLAYGAYKSAADLLRALNEDTDMAQEYDKKAQELRVNCDKYFGGTVMGYDTYKYFEGNTKLRSWICLPLTMGIFDRKEETLKALFSPQLWNKDGIYTEAGNQTFWDRSTLYAFKGIFYAGETDLAMKYFKYYSQKRLLGEHVPYAVEAWPEGGQRQLSAESALYCRVVTEGLFGIIPTGFRSFTCSPFLPEGWNSMTLKNIKSFNSDFDIIVKREKNNFEVILTSGNQVIQKRKWDGNRILEFELP